MSDEMLGCGLEVIVETIDDLRSVEAQRKKKPGMGSKNEDSPGPSGSPKKP